jgi:predicted ATPase
MITYIEIDGFKSFRNFKTYLRPFQVIVGGNGVGKSNLFDAILLLSHLAQGQTVVAAFQQGRGEVQELFTLSADGSYGTRMRFVVELLIDATVQDNFANLAEVSNTRLRYELELERRKEGLFERLYVVYEDLSPLSQAEDSYVSEWIVRSTGPKRSYISTQDGEFIVSQDKRQGRKMRTPNKSAQQTVLSTFNTTDYPTAFAARQEMLNWQYLQLNPSVLNQACSMRLPAVQLLSDGANLPLILHRLEVSQKNALTDISRRFAYLVPGFLDVWAEANPDRQQMLIKARTVGGEIFSAGVLSEGSLRILALTVLVTDWQHHGLLCFEEPENGIKPGKLKDFMALLQELASDLQGAPLAESRLRQIIINSHSPEVVAYTSPENILYAYMTKNDPRTLMIPIEKPASNKHEEGEAELRHYSRQQVIAYLQQSQAERQSLLESLQ